MTIKRKVLWTLITICLFLTWLPYFGIFNGKTMIAGLPQPLALTLACNVILTLCTIAIYPLYFRPLINTLRRRPLIQEDGHE